MLILIRVGITADWTNEVKLTMSDCTILYGVFNSVIVISRHLAAVLLKPAPGNHAGTWRTVQGD